MSRTVRAAPNAAMLTESMRDIGYNLESALADIIDNAITASARNIHLLTGSEDGVFRIGIVDDGHGMSEADLLAAMHIGSRNPLLDRDAADLGRFGLGLKTASFSQCRRLTVVTRRDRVTSAATWDLDCVAQADDWLLQVPDDLASLPWLDRLGDAGTLVLWENLDRLVDGAISPDEARVQKHVHRRIDDAREHLELVFHRFLSGRHPAPRTAILLNERKLEPFDPFNSNHPATQWGQTEQILVADRPVQVQPCTLPHFSKVTQQEWERYAGRAGYLKNQGFYVYRANRLIIYGTWFGLARQTALTQLARVRIDMPNGLDAQWKIDVKKASAQPPYQVRDRLRKLIDSLGASSRRVFTGKAPALATDGDLPMWNRTQSKGEILYRVNSSHPVLEDFAAQLPRDLAPSFDRVVDLLSSTLPLNALLVDLSGSPEQVAGTGTSAESLEYAFTRTVDRLRNGGTGPKEITETLSVIEPFRSNWDRTLLLLAELPDIEVHDE